MKRMNTEPIKNRIKNILESLLFVARKPLSAEEVEKVLQQKALQERQAVAKGEIIAYLEEMINEYQGKGVNIVKAAGGYLMGTNPDNADYVHNLLHAKLQTTLSPQALETLAIIAYKQPVTRAEVERIRGVNSDGPIDTLLAKKMIRELGRSEAVGRPYLYGTTNSFLRHFGLKDLTDLPPLPVSQEEQESLFKSALHEEQPEKEMVQEGNAQPAAMEIQPEEAQEAVEEQKTEAVIEATEEKREEINEAPPEQPEGAQITAKQEEIPEQSKPEPLEEQRPDL